MTQRSRHKPRPTPTIDEQSTNTENLVEWDLPPDPGAVMHSELQEDHTIAEDLVQEGINEAEDDYRKRDDEMLI